MDVMSHPRAVEIDCKPGSDGPAPFHKLKRFLEKAFPECCEALRERWYERVSYKMLKSIAVQHSFAVQSGPFQGMRYLPELLSTKKVVKYVLLPKILGCYEEELHGVLMEAIKRNYHKIVNIGSSEGYYSIGLSLRLSDARVFAFDTDASARQLCQRMARLNGVESRVIVEGECTTEHLQVLAGSRTLVICDCEGFELGLLRPDLAPSLNMSDVLVELHDCVDPNISKAVPNRFARTHEVTVLTRLDRDPSACPSLEGFSPYKQRLAVSEHRWGTPCVWSFMTARCNEQV